MLLEPLVSAIDTVKARISTHGPTLRENETRTRMALVDPLLQALAWDTSDPSLVLPEFDVSGRKADYALLGRGGSPSATVEAKKLGEPLAPHRMQMLNYSNASGVEYAGLTDGDKWELYEVFKRGQLEERRVLNVSIAEEPAHEVALKLLLLWRPNLESGQPVSANGPLFSVHSEGEPTIVPQPPTPTPVPDRTEKWISLSTVEAGKSNTPPRAVKFPGKAPLAIGSWRQVLVEAADKLANEGLLTADQCPIGGLGFINSSPHGPSGVPFRAHKAITGGLCVNTHSGARGILFNSRKLLTHFGVNPGTVELLFD